MFFGRQLWFELKITYSARSECTYIIGWVPFWFRILIFCFKKMCNKCNIFFKSPMHRNKDANSKMILSHHGAILYGGKWNQLGYGRMFMYNCIVRLYYTHLGLQSTNARSQHSCPLWQYRLWSFQAGGTKLERFFHTNQHTQRKLLNFEFWINGKLSKISLVIKWFKIYFIKKCQ